MAMASVVCASRLIEPKDMAPVAKRLTISAAGSTSSSGTGCAAHVFRGLRMLEHAAHGHELLGLLVDLGGIVTVALLAVAPDRVLQIEATEVGDHMCRSPRMR